jgi:hypothetical protein
VRERLPRVEGGGLGFEVAAEEVEVGLEEREKPWIAIFGVGAPEDGGSLEGDIL